MKRKGNPVWVSYEREEGCMVDLGEVVVDVACARDLFLCSVLFQRKRCEQGVCKLFFKYITLVYLYKRPHTPPPSPTSKLGNDDIMYWPGRSPNNLICSTTTLVHGKTCISLTIIIAEPTSCWLLNKPSARQVILYNYSR